MKEKEQDLKERYIYQVIRRVPKNQREEIKMELNELISDMCEDDIIEHVLEKLGNPEEFAKKYRDENGYVIGPKYYDNYIWMLKIVLICVAISVVCSALVNGIMEQDWSVGGIDVIINMVADIIADTIANGIVSICAAFGGVTLVFAIMERQNVKMNEKQTRNWSPEQLTPIPEKKGIIGRSDSVVGIVFIMIFGGVLLFAPELFGAYIFEDGTFIRTIPVFNMEKWNIILPFLMAGFGICFVDEMIHLVTGCYCKVVMVSNIVTGMIQMVLAIIILKILPLWNKNFAEECSVVFDREFTSKGDLLHYWGTDLVSDIILAGVIVIILLEISVTIYKTLRYGTKK